MKGVSGDGGGQIRESVQGPSSLLQRPELPLCVHEPHFSETRRRKKAKKKKMEKIKDVGVERDEGRRGEVGEGGGEVKGALL